MAHYHCFDVGFFHKHLCIGTKTTFSEKKYQKYINHIGITISFVGLGVWLQQSFRAQNQKQCRLWNGRVASNGT
jgi:UDP-N-acetyl-D-mannosaminuronic acid transferase (WecB/TagA/CpsF family)